MRLEFTPEGTQILVADDGARRELKDGEDQETVAAAFRAEHPDAKPPVPESVTPLQMRKALRHLGLKAAVDAYIATLDEETVEEWEYALAIERGNATLQAAATGLGMTDEHADDLFRLAGSL